MNVKQLRDAVVNGSVSRDGEDTVLVTSKNGKEHEVQVDDVVKDWGELCRLIAEIRGHWDGASFLKSSHDDNRTDEKEHNFGEIVKGRLGGNGEQ